LSMIESVDKKIMSRLKEHFKPEFLNRIDEIIIFDALTRDDIRQIVDLQLERVAKRLKEKEIAVKFGDSVKQMLAEQGYDPQFGARPLKRLIQNKILDLLALKIIEGKVKEKINIEFKNKEIIFNEK